MQRTRSYSFLITLCASLAIAYTFVPEPNTNYTTIRIADYVGYYNSAWFGYITAIMASVFLSLVGFYLINSGIKKDIDLKVGQIVASTSISNFKYLFSKVLSNFLVLMTIICIVFTMSIILFMLYNDGFPFEPFQFIKPYFFITIPTMFLISVLAVVFEVLFGTYSVLQNVAFFFLFTTIMSLSAKTGSDASLDFFGNDSVLRNLEEKVREISKSDEKPNLTIGYTMGNRDESKKFHFNGIDFPTKFIFSRLVLILFGTIIIVVISPIFHRFNVKEQAASKKLEPIIERQKVIKEISLPSLPKPQINFAILPLVKTEFLLLLRKGKRWLWLLNLTGMILLAVLPLKIAHQMVLPILWFLQVSRLSDLTTKEITNNIQYFSLASYRPISRLFVSQLLAGIVLMLLTALPLIVRLGLLSNFSEAVSVTLGGILIVVSAALFGIISKGTKLFEVLFFMITYANINGIVLVDYFGGFEHHSYYMLQISALIIIGMSISFIKRNYQLRQ